MVNLAMFVAAYQNNFSMKSKLVKNTLYILFFFVGLIVTSCTTCVEGEGEVVTQKYDVSDFSEINVDLDAIVVLVKGEPGVTIEAQSNIQFMMVAEVKRNTLKLHASSCIVAETPVKITISTPKLTEIQLNGQVNLTTVNLITAKKLVVKAGHQSTLNLNVFVNDLDVRLKENAMLMITGNCQNADIEMDEANMFDGFGFNANSMNIELNGSGKATVSVLNKMKARVKGNGEILYTGDPQVETSIDGSGRVTKVN